MINSKTARKIMYIGFTAIASLTHSMVVNAADCGITSPAPPPQPEGPGLQVNDTCAFPPPVLETPNIVFPSASGFDNEASRFPDMQAWISFAQAIQPIAGIGGYTFVGWPTQHQAYSKPTASVETMTLLESTKKMTSHFAPNPPLQQLLRESPKVPLQQLLREKQLKPFTAEGEAPEAAGAINCRMDSMQLTHLNPTLVTFLRKENLWNRVGIDAYTSNGKKIVMPQGAVEVKSDWVNVGTNTAPGYVTMQDSGGNTWKMIAFHVISKQLPNWTWATFEHKDNPCYGKFLHPRDTFGFVNGANSPSSELLAVFSHYGVDTNVANNYRLDGAQTDFTDDTGRPIILGNSVTESGFQTTSSCITCHSRASVSASGTPALSVFTPEGQSFNGPIQADWYFGADGKQNNFTTDFMWSLAFCPAADESSDSACP